MNGLKAYQIDLNTLKQGVYNYEYKLDNAFFAELDQQDIHGGEVYAKVALTVLHIGFMLNIKLSGNVILTCDRCLDEMIQPIDTEERLQVKLTKAETDDDIVAVDPNSGILDLNWLLYELTAISLPLVHSHQQGGCNPQMEELLQSHLCTTTEEPEDNL